MCYACTQCGKCGKFKEGSPFYRPLSVPCLQCGGELDLETGVCTGCGNIAFTPTGSKVRLQSSQKA